jgi:hypothetical protein
MGVKRGLSCYGKRIDWGCLRTGFWEECLDLRGMMWQENVGSCTKRSFINCTHHHHHHHMALQPNSGPGHPFWGFLTTTFLRDWIVCPAPSPQPGGPGLRIYDPRRQGCPAIPSGTGYPFYDMHGLQWDYPLIPATTRENLYSFPNIIRQIKSRRMRWAGHVARMREDRKCTRFWWEGRRKETTRKTKA